MKSLFVIFAAAFVAVAAARLGPKTGGWSTITDLNDPTVKEIAKFAISEYNSKSQARLSLKRIVKGETQVVAGTNYRLVLAVNGGASPQYEAVVWDKPWEHFRNLTSFEPLSS